MVKQKRLFAGLILVIILFTIWLFMNFSDTSLDAKESPKVDFYDQDCQSVDIGFSTFCLWVADSQEEQTQGLSDISPSGGIEIADGMIFLFDDSSIKSFWMNHTMMDLDVLWVENGVVKKIDQNVPHHSWEYDDDLGDFIFIGEPIRMDSYPYEVDKVIELFAGAVELYGIQVGEQVSFN